MGWSYAGHTQRAVSADIPALPPFLTGHAVQHVGTVLEPARTCSRHRRRCAVLPTCKTSAMGQPGQYREWQSSGAFTCMIIEYTIEKRSCPGAPLRNRTVDLLLTMETLCRLS
jgi:hypothetical protein